MLWMPACASMTRGMFDIRCQGYSLPAMNEARDKPTRRKLRTGFTTGACATAAARAAYAALLDGAFPDPVRIALPGGERPAFPLALAERGEGFARAGVVKDAGDDPDVTHGALIIATVRPLPPGSGMHFRAGEGVGTITLPGLPLPPGEPAINPGPRLMIRDNLAAELAARGGRGEPDVEVEVSIAGGEKLAEKTMNARLGIIGGLSVLGTTGIVRPYSCAAWIAAIREGVDVARALGLEHIVGATGRTSERAAQKLFDLPEQALIDMGGFVGGLLKYVRTHPVPRLTIAGGPAKLAKLAQGALDLHSSRSNVDMAALAHWAREAGADASLVERLATASSTAEALRLSFATGLGLPAIIARHALRQARAVLGATPARTGVLVVAREGEILAHVEESVAS